MSWNQHWLKILVLWCNLSVKQKINDIYGKLHDNISSQSGDQGCIFKKLRRLSLSENWNTLKNEITRVKIINIAIYIKATPLAQKNKFSTLHPLLSCYCSFVFILLDFEQRVKFLCFKVSFHQPTHLRCLICCRGGGTELAHDHKIVRYLEPHCIAFISFRDINIRK